MSKYRNTGRTLRMVNEAITLTKEGRAVYIVTANNNHARSVREMISEKYQYTIKVETLNTLDNYDILTNTLIGAHPNCVVLVDHYVVEYYWGRLLDIVNRYNLDLE